MLTWKNKLKGCFGTDDKKFGRHAADEQSAKELKKELRITKTPTHKDYSS